MASKWWTLIAVCIAIFMLLLDITVVNVALPSIQHDLDASFSDLQWVVDAYALMLAATLLAAGALADRAGRRRVFSTGLVVFTVASLVCGLAQTPLQLHLARGVQGVGGAVMFATSLALLAHAFRGPERGVAFGIWGATTGLAVAIGPLVGGLLTDTLAWEWIFFVNIPIGVFAIALTMRYVEESRNPTAARVDWPGVVTFSGALFALVYALITGNTHGWGSARIVTLLVSSAVLLVVFVVLQLKESEPMFDLSLFRVPTFVGVSIAAVTLSASLFAMFLYITLYLQSYLGYGPLAAGVRLLPVSLLSFVFAAFSGSMSERLPVRWLMASGLTMTAIGLALMGGRDPGDAWTSLLPGFVVSGIGIGLVNPPLASTAIGVVEPQRSGVASGINSTFRQVGIALGIAVLGAVFEHTVGSAAVGPAARNPVFVDGFNRIVIMGSATAFVGAVMTAALVRRSDLVSASHRPDAT